MTPGAEPRTPQRRKIPTLSPTPLRGEKSRMDRSSPPASATPRCTSAVPPSASRLGRQDREPGTAAAGQRAPRREAGPSSLWQGGPGLEVRQRLGDLRPGSPAEIRRAGRDCHLLSASISPHKAAEGKSVPHGAGHWLPFRTDLRILRWLCCLFSEYYVPGTGAKRAMDFIIPRSTP